MSDKITCQLCQAETHTIKLHLEREHPEHTVDTYQSLFPDAPLLSLTAEQAIAKRRQELLASKTEAAGMTSNVSVLPTVDRQEAMHERFGLGSAQIARNARGEGIPITVRGSSDWDRLIPDIDNDFVWDIEMLKNGLMGVELNIPTMIWGHAGTGKTVFWEQVCARTNRPVIRVQHTINTEEDHVLGHWVVRSGQTVYEPGPLTRAMLYGWTYLADEYDFGMPSVLSVYQPVLEGKPLVIKDADEKHMIVRPHPHFRFVATGNTNGSGDDTGLYQGTSLQNAANYSRFGITHQAKYLSPEQETLVIQRRASVSERDARALVDWANAIRRSFEGGESTMTVGPRELIYAAKLGARKASFRAGVQLAVTNRWSTVDREVGDQLAQRHLA